MITKYNIVEIKKIVKSIIKKYLYITKFEFDDLYFEGILEAMKAIEEYDNTKNTKLSTYIYSRVNYRMIYLIRRENAIKRNDSKNILLEMMISENNQDIYNAQIKQDVNIEDEIIKEDLKKFFKKDLSQVLNKREYEYIELLLDGYSIKEIGKIKGMDSRQVSNKIYYIKKKLRRYKDKFEKYRNLF